MTNQHEPSAERQVIFRGDMTVKEASDAFQKVWPTLRIEFHHGTITYYKEGYSDDSFIELDATLSKTYPDREAVIKGSMKPYSHVRDAVYKAFGLEVEVYRLNEQTSVYAESLDACLMTNAK